MLLRVGVFVVFLTFIVGNVSLIYHLTVIIIVFFQPVGFRSLEDLKHLLIKSPTPPGTLHLATTVNPATNTDFFLPAPKKENGWLSFGVYVVASVLASGGAVFSCMCGCKFVRNGCMCKVKHFSFFRKHNYKKIFLSRDIGSTQKVGRSTAAETN